jgi:hypothetical protein
VPEQLLGLLKLCLLALLYLFFARVLWAVWSEVRAVRPQTEGAGPAAGPGSVAEGGGAARRARKRAPDIPHRLTIAEPPGLRGSRFDLSASELTVGRAPGCHVSLPDDTFASTLHARVFARDGTVYVEDLGSTNGTFVNGLRLSAPAVLRPGDQLQVGSTVMEAS